LISSATAAEFGSKQAQGNFESRSLADSNLTRCTGYPKIFRDGFYMKNVIYPRKKKNKKSTFLARKIRFTELDSRSDIHMHSRKKPSVYEEYVDGGSPSAIMVQSLSPLTAILQAYLTHALIMLHLPVQCRDASVILVYPEHRQQILC